jgi:hypothetical protein
MPNLTAQTLQCILDDARIAHDFLDLEDVWVGLEPVARDYDLVALSTTFICNFQILRRALNWVRSHFPSATIVLGGQFSNLKYAGILARFPCVDFIVRGDAEEAFPRLLHAIDRGERIEGIPNIVWGNPLSGETRGNQISYIDLESWPSPKFPGKQRMVPYESMRGCPFGCKYCSYPSASPKWRYKSAQRICNDWKTYARNNGTEHIRCMDSTFTVPPARFTALLETIPETNVSWEAYARANAIKEAVTVDALERAHCRSLSIGFESMSSKSLNYMGKGITPEQNLRALQLLSDSRIELRASFMVGYPGETPDDYACTHRFLVCGFEGQFRLSVFSFLDETMPVWTDAARYQIELTDPENPDYSWKHCGMDVETARRLQLQTIREVRWKNERAVLSLWQGSYDEPLIPGLNHQENNRIEKLVERLAFLPKDFESETSGTARFNAIENELSNFGVEIGCVDLQE